jgi:uncharacterized protein YigE (DUF2233 family)
MQMGNFRMVGLLFVLALLSFTPAPAPVSDYTQEDRFESYIADPATTNLAFFWKDEKGTIFRSFANLETHLNKKNQHLIFAMNGGMYKADHSPQGLYIEKGKLIASLDTTSGQGNFYVKPNGIFYLTADRKARVCQTSELGKLNQISYATQSGPMLVINGKIHPSFTQGSTNVHIRNGVGILPDHRIVFAISTTRTNFYDFAAFFQKLGCKNALYLDGFVSRMYLPGKGRKELDGDFGVIIGVVK